jgi:hypothetical protein
MRVNIPSAEELAFEKTVSKLYCILVNVPAGFTLPPYLPN